MRTARSAENIEAVSNAIEEAREESVTRLNLHFHPYQMIRQHRLLPGDLQQGVRFCQWLLDKNKRFLDDLIIGDESGFALNVLVNTHNGNGTIN